MGRKDNEATSEQRISFSRQDKKVASFTLSLDVIMAIELYIDWHNAKKKINKSEFVEGAIWAFLKENGVKVEKTLSMAFPDESPA